MNEVKISELIETKEVTQQDYMMIVQNGMNKKIKVSEVGTGQVGGDTEPIGVIKEFAGEFANIPEGYLLCNGQEVSRKEYASLFNVVGTTFGKGDGINTFNVPDRQGVVAIGTGDYTDKNGKTVTIDLGKIIGEYEHKTTIEELASHGHDFLCPDGEKRDNVAAYNPKDSGQDPNNGSSGYRTYGNVYITNTGEDKPHNNTQPSIGMNFIIKANYTVGVIAKATEQECIDGIIDDKYVTPLLINKLFIRHMKLIFPIGSKYITQTETNPAEILGFGTWERFKRIDLGLDEMDSDMNAIGKIGGEKKHKQTLGELVTHSHQASLQVLTLSSQGIDSSQSGPWKATYVKTTEDGGGQPFNVMNPFEIVGYMWIRRA